MDNIKKSAVAGILAEYNNFYLSLQRDEAVLAAIEARIAESKRRMFDFQGAFKVFGYGPVSVELWAKLKEDLGESDYFAALAAGKAMFEGVSPEIGLSKQIEVKAVETKDNAVLVVERPKIRDAVLALLKEKGDAGDGATSLRKQIEAKYYIELHEKTVGMTLYRLSQDGLVRRDGRTWFFVPPKAETKDPGASTPGQTSLLDLEGGTDA